MVGKRKTNFSLTKATNSLSHLFLLPKIKIKNNNRILLWLVINNICYFQLKNLHNLSNVLIFILTLFEFLNLDIVELPSPVDFAILSVGKV